DVRSFKNYNSESFKAELSQLPFNETYRINDVNEKIDHFNQLFINTLDKHAPIKHIRIKGRLNQFINKELKCTMRLKDKKLRIFCLSRKAEDWHVYRQLRNSIKTSLRAAQSNFVRNQIEEYKDSDLLLIDLFKFRTVTPDEVRTIILNSPLNKAPGADKINTQLIKDPLEVILDPATDIINCSLMTSTYSSMWKIAEVVPLHKEGDPQIASNNRPISLLSSWSKICDKVALNQYTEHLINHRLLTEHQSGNRKKHSTETLNIAVTDMLLEAMDNKQLSMVILLDVSKAFDSVDHNMLLQRILNLGVSSAVLSGLKVTCLTDG
ncbi:Hypothetical predicted protein, partial [Paramuricea clavata]